MITYEKFNRLANHFSSLHNFTWPVDLTRLDKITPRGTETFHHARGVCPDKRVSSEMIAHNELNQIFNHGK